MGAQAPAGAGRDACTDHEPWSSRMETSAHVLLDTETGGLAEQLYLSMGWQEVGVVPGFALTPHGELCATTFLYKAL